LRFHNFNVVVVVVVVVFAFEELIYGHFLSLEGRRMFRNCRLVALRVRHRRRRRHVGGGRDWKTGRGRYALFRGPAFSFGFGAWRSFAFRKPKYGDRERREKREERGTVVTRSVYAIHRYRFASKIRESIVARNIATKISRGRSRERERERERAYVRVYVFRGRERTRLLGRQIALSPKKMGFSSSFK